VVLGFRIAASYSSSARMTQTLVRMGTFLLGLLGFRGLELLSPDHPPTVPLRPRWIANLSLGALNGVIVSAVCASCFVLAAPGVIPWPLAPLRAFSLGPWLRIPLEVAFLDLLVYLLHRSYHAVPFLWRFHAVHHSDLDLDVSSASRFHAGEVIVSSAAKVLVVVVIGISPAGLVAFEAVMLACAQLQHANIRLPQRLDTLLWRTLVPPAMHRIHHTPTRQDTDSNYGTILTAWDALFGTLRRRPGEPIARFGVEGLRPQPLGVLVLAALPFRRVEPPRMP